MKHALQVTKYVRVSIEYTSSPGNKEQ